MTEARESLAGRRLILGVTGCIAAYKAATVLREFMYRGATVRVVMTPNATKFVAPLTFRALSGHTVYVDPFTAYDPAGWQVDHIELAVNADAVVVAPATANVIGKLCAGITDDFLTTLICATRAPVIFCPAMNPNMYTNPIVQRNVASLRELGYYFVDPEVGPLAALQEGEGQGRLAEPATIITAVERLLIETTTSGED